MIKIVFLQRNLIVMATTAKVRPLGNSSCPYHVDKDVIYVCEDCTAGTLVCSECVTTRHRTHRLGKLANTIPWKKEQVLRYIDDTETHKLPSIQKDIATLDTKLLENKTTFQDLILNLKTHASLWKEGIDNYVETHVQNFLELEKQNTEVLLKHKCELLNQSSDIKSLLGNHRNTLQCGNHVQIFDIKTGHYMQSSIPHTKIAKFKQREFSEECLPHVFGSVEIKNDILYEKTVAQTKENGCSAFLKPQQNPKLVRRNSTGRIRESSVTKRSEQKASCLKVEQNSKHVRRNSVTEQLIKPVKKSELKPNTKKISNTRRHSTSTSINNDNVEDTKKSSNPSDTKEGQSNEGQGHFQREVQNGGYTLVSPVQLVKFESSNGSVDFVSPTKDDLAWVCKYNDTSVQLLDLMGDVQEEVVSPSGITGVSQAPDNGNLWLSCLDRGIREIVKQNPKAPLEQSCQEHNIKIVSLRPNLAQRRKSTDGNVKENMSQTSTKIQRQMSLDFTEGSNRYHRKGSFDSSFSDRSSQQHKLGLNELKTNSKRRKAVSRSLNEVEARLAGLGKSSESNSYSDDFIHCRQKTPVLPRINIIPPDSNSSIVCIFDNGDECSPQKHQQKMPSEIQSQKDKKRMPQHSCEQQITTILKEGNRRAIIRFYVEDTPWSLCITRNNNILVGMANTIVVHTAWGQILRQILREGWFTYNTPRVTSLQQMVQCPFSGNIAVMERSNHGTQQVFILDSKLNLITNYAGEKDCNDKMSAISTSPFSAAALCYDSVGNLVVADSNNRCLVLISGAGQYLKTLHQDTWATQAVGLQEENILWAAFKLYSNVEVKLIKYTE